MTATPRGADRSHRLTSIGRTPQRVTLAQAQPVDVTTTQAQPQPTDTQPLTVAQTEGPYFKTNSPERTSLLDGTVQGTVLTITGQVLAADGTPVANALV